MNTRRTATCSVGEEIVNAGGTPTSNRNSLQVKVAVNDQDPVNPLSITDGEVRAALFQMA